MKKDEKKGDEVTAGPCSNTSTSPESLNDTDFAIEIEFYNFEDGSYNFVIPVQYLEHTGSVESAKNVLSYLENGVKPMVDKRKVEDYETVGTIYIQEDGKVHSISINEEYKYPTMKDVPVTIPASLNS